MCTDVYQCVLMCTNVYCCVLKCTNVYWWVPMCTNVYWCVLICTDVYWCVLMCTDVYWCVPMCTDVYWCLLLVGLGTWAQEHQSNVHCFFYRIRLTIIWSINAHINTHQYWSSVHTSTHYQSTSPPPASFSTSSTFETLQKCALQPNTVPGRLEKQKKQDGPAISHIYIYIHK